MFDLSGKHGVIVGVANKRSIAWAIAEAADRAGAQLVVTYVNERLERNVRKLATTLSRPPLIVPCDVAQDSQINELAESVKSEFGGLDFLVHGAAFAPREAISAPFLDTKREDFQVALDVSTYSLVALSRAVAPLMV